METIKKGKTLKELLKTLFAQRLHNETNAIKV